MQPLHRFSEFETRSVGVIGSILDEADVGDIIQGGIIVGRTKTSQFANGET